MGKVRVPGLNEAMNEGAQVLIRAHGGTTQALATQYRAPNLHLIEPGAMRGQSGEGDRGPLGGAPVHHCLLLMVAGIVHDQMPAAVGVTQAQGAQEVAKFPVGMTLITLRKDGPRAHVKGGKEVDRAVAEIFKFLSLDQPDAATASGVGRATGI